MTSKYILYFNNGDIHTITGCNMEYTRHGTIHFLDKKTNKLIFIASIVNLLSVDVEE